MPSVRGIFVLITIRFVKEHFGEDAHDKASTTPSPSSRSSTTWDLSAILRASQPLRACVREDGLSGRFDDAWRSRVSWNCLTGACQIALVWARLSKRVEDPEYARAASSLLGFVRRTQVLSSEGGWEAGLCGGIKGSHPVWGEYDPFRLPNWAAKFFVDALLASGSA